MKKTIIILTVLSLIIITGCQQKQTTTEPNITITDLNKAKVLEQFDKLDLELNTNWKEEKIPNNMIPVKAVGPWTANMYYLRDCAIQENDSTILNLIDARIDMLKTQTALYLIKKEGEKGYVEMIIEGKKFVPDEKIDCKDVNTIARTLGLYNTAYKTWINFTMHLDMALQDPEIAEQIGINQKRPAFYSPEAFQNAEAYIKAAKKAVYDQCQVEIVIQDMMKAPQPDEALS